MQRVQALSVAEASQVSGGFTQYLAAGIIAAGIIWGLEGSLNGGSQYPVGPQTGEP